MSRDVHSRREAEAGLAGAEAAQGIATRLVIIAPKPLVVGLGFVCRRHERGEFIGRNGTTPELNPQDRSQCNLSHTLLALRGWRLRKRAVRERCESLGRIGVRLVNTPPANYSGNSPREKTTRLPGRHGRERSCCR